MFFKNYLHNLKIGRTFVKNKYIKIMKLKENYTREEVDLTSLISTILKSIPHSYQGDSAYWEILEVDFKSKELLVDVSEEVEDIIYYALVGIATTKGFSFSERF